MLITAFLTAVVSVLPAHARDFGVEGPVFPIAEADPRVLIQQKLKALEEAGELKRHQEILYDKVKARLLHPLPVKGLARAPVSRTFTIDPTYTCPRDIKDHKGRIFIRRGTRINPLETVSLSAPLVFFDGEDQDQVAWVLSFLKNPKHQGTRLVLVKGSPLVLSGQWRRPLYFDQEGGLTKKLDLRHVPVVIHQEGSHLRGEEIHLPPPSSLTNRDSDIGRVEKPLEKTR